MLQDLERDRTLEIDAPVTVVQELGRLIGVPTPTINVVLPLVHQLQVEVFRGLSNRKLVTIRA